MGDLVRVIWAHFQFDYIGGQTTFRPLFSNPIYHEPVTLNGPALSTMVAIVVRLGGFRIILLVGWKRLLQLESDLIILGPHLSFSVPPAPIDHSGLLLTFPAFVVIPYAYYDFGSVWALFQDAQRVKLGGHEPYHLSGWIIDEI